MALGTAGTYHDPHDRHHTPRDWPSVEGNNALLDVDQVARRLNVPERFVRRLIAEGRIPYIKVGHYVRFQPEQVQAFVDAGARPPRGPDKSGGTPP